MQKFHLRPQKNISPATTSLSSTVHQWPVLALLCIAQFTVVLDVQVVAIALPAIQHALALSQGELQWIVNAYVLLFGGFLMLAGRAADLFGRRRFFIIGLLLFAFAALGCGLAPTATWLIAARALQGLGAALISPSALSLLTSAFPAGPARNRALGWWGAAAPLGGVTGLLLGGMLTGGPGWPWVFFINVPIGLLGAILAPFVLLESRAPHSMRLDVAGAVTGTAGLATLVYALTRMGDASADTTGTISVLVLALVLLLSFIIVQKRVRNPLLPFAIFRRRTFAGATLVALLLTFVTSPPIFFGTLYLQQVAGSTPFMTGLAFLPESLSIAACSAIGAWLLTRMGARRGMALGMGVLIVSMLIQSRLTVHDGYLYALLPGMIILGFGLGVASVASTSAGMAGVEAAEQGLVAGVLNTAAQVGTALGLALLNTIVVARVTHLKSSGYSFPVGLVDGMHWAFLASVVVALVGALIALFVVDT